MNVVAFMQCPWFEPGTPKELVDRYTTDQQFHQRLLENTMSGRRLVQAFGHELFHEIWWDNVAPATDHAAGKMPTDMQHVERVIRAQQADLILTFGKQAEDAIKQSLQATRIKTMACHHPNARFKFQEDLDNFAQQTREWISARTFERSEHEP